jgi:ParB family chromosome partitioning protein
VAVQRKNGLGRGLDALFGEINVAVAAVPEPKHEGRNVDTGGTESSVLYIDIDAIKPNAMQPRQQFNEENIEGLAESIRLHGVIQPIMLRESGTGYELVAGERRWRAARKAGLREIPAIVRTLSSEENALFAIIENVQREDLNPLEEAGAFRKIMDVYGMTQENISRSVGKSRPYIANTLRLLKLPQEIREMITAGNLTSGHANALGGIKDSEKQLAVARQVVREGLSVREVELLAAKLSGKQKEAAAVKAKPRRKNEEIRRVEEELTGLIGTRVTINSNGKNGVVEIHYYSRDELEGLIDDFRAMRKR